MLLIAGLAGFLLLPAPWNVLAVVAAAVIEVAEVWFWIRFLRRYRVSTGAEGMVGRPAEVIAPVGPDGGTVRVHGEIWSARSQAELDVGARAVVAGVDGLTLVVEPPGA
jgi:membrane-bound serine protease (ClpP class)